MTALTSNKLIENKWDNKQGKVPLASGAKTIYRGALLNSNAAGYGVLGTDTASELFAGVALDSYVQASTAVSGDNEVPVFPAKSGVIIEDIIIVDNVTQANIRQKVYVEDSATVALAATSTNDVEMGEIVKIKGQNLVDIHLV